MRSQITETLLSDIRKVQPKVSKEDSRRIKESLKIINTALSLSLSLSLYTSQLAHTYFQIATTT
jgi:hypothetical protein